MSELNKPDFEKALNTKFTLMDEGREVGFFELVAVESSKYATLPGREATGRPFSLMLLGRHTNVLPQRTYDFKNEVIGEISMFIVPVAQTPEGFTYEAVFN